MGQRGPVENFPIAGKIIVVTGGGSGIGFALVQSCIEHGARVVIGDLRLTREADEYLEKATKNKAIFKKCDVTHWRDLHDLISVSVEAFQEVPDVYCPCAGIFEPTFSNFWDDEQDSYKTIKVNLEHPIKLTRLAMRALAGAEKQGVVCLVASSAAIRPNYLACLYSASKHGLLGFAKSMGQADGDEGVRVVCICPGPVDTPLWFDRKDNMIEWTKHNTRNPLQASDIADIIVRMIEDGGTYPGGCCVLKTAVEERIVEKGHTALMEQLKEYDPSPRAEPDLSRVKDSLEKERGISWK